jgi:hypothetical protein
LRREDAADWVSGVLGISLAGAGTPLAVLEMDGRDGTVREAGGGEKVKKLGNWEIL